MRVVGMLSNFKKEMNILLWIYSTVERVQEYSRLPFDNSKPQALFQTSVPVHLFPTQKVSRPQRKG